MCPMCCTTQGMWKAFGIQPWLTVKIFFLEKFHYLIGRQAANLTQLFCTSAEQSAFESVLISVWRL